MSLLSLPTELRLHIYDYLPELQPDRYETVTSYSKLTPSICRVSRTLRAETIPIFAANSIFAIQIESNSSSWDARIAAFLAALGPEAISRIRSLQISRHWAIPQPMRWQGHVGFYVRIEQRKPRKISSKSSVASNSAGTFRPEWNARFVRPMMEGIWEVTTGTYPIARDMRGMRLESVELLAEIVRHHLHVPTPVSSNMTASNEMRPGLQRNDVEFLHRAIGIVASNPISTYDVEQAESGRRRRYEAWTTMEQKLRALNVHSTLGSEDVEIGIPYRFFTPY